MAKYLKLNEKATDQFSFYDGPITANNPMGVHHALGRTLKDAVLRYQTFLGKRLRYQNGFDCQGLWIEVEVEKSLKLNSKKEILNYGLDNFSKACKERVKTFGSLITEQSQQLGQFMDWNNSYWTHSDTNIEHIWYFLGKCHDNGWLYKGYRIMPWCTRCETSLSQHEQTDSYKEIVHPSIYVQFNIFKTSKLLKSKLGDRKAHFLVWTTTPWTLPANVAVAVNPELTYVLIFDDVTNNTLIVGEKAFETLKFLKNFTKLDTISGKDLVSTQLSSLTESFVPKQKDLKIPVVAADFVSKEDGTGLVHIAPGCGLDDYELGTKLNLPMFAPLNEDGTFLEEFGFLGVNHLEVSKQVQNKLEKLGLLFKRSSLKHRYPVCWRCGHELVFRMVEEWFIRTDEIRPKLLSVVEDVNWYPYYMKDQMKNWLTNMGDWCISRKRFWGLPLPFFECSCGHLTVVSRLEELYELAGYSSEEKFRNDIPDLHRPYVDDLEITCPSCSKKVKRVLAVGDCWLDAGIMPFSTLNYLKNHDNESLWNKWFPADFVVEMREQIRLWFYSLLFMSVTLTGKAPYKTVMAYENVLDEKGEAMHKSKGNAIWWYETAEKVGSDANRLFYAGWDPAKQLLYGYNNLKKSLNDFNTFWSCCRFLQQNLALSPKYWSHLSQDLNSLKLNSRLDQWLVVNLEHTHRLVLENYNKFDLEHVRELVDRFWNKVSTFWLRNSRERFWSYDDDLKDDSNLVAYQLLWHSVVMTLFWLAPIAPHVTEYLFQLLVRPFTQQFKESLHLNILYDPPFPEINKFLEVTEEVTELESVLETGRNLRQMAKIKVRYVLPDLFIDNVDKKKLGTLQQNWKSVLERELNVKNITFKKPPVFETTECVSLTKSGYFVTLPLVFSETLQMDWLQSELIRTLQFLRKEANLSTKERTDALIVSESIVTLDFRSSFFLEKLQKEVLVQLLPDGYFKSHNNINPKDWLSKKVEFNSQELSVYLKRPSND